MLSEQHRATRSHWVMGTFIANMGTIDSFEISSHTVHYPAHVCKQMGDVNLEGFPSYRRALHQDVLPVSEPLLCGSLYYRVSKHKKQAQYCGLVGLLWPLTCCLFQHFFFFFTVLFGRAWSGLHTKNTLHGLGNSLGNQKIVM